MSNQVDNQFGIAFVDEVPPEPVKRERDDERWEAVKAILKGAPGKWASVKKYDNKGSAGQKVSVINADKFKALPGAEWEARSKHGKDKDGNDYSELFLMFKGDGAVKADVAPTGTEDKAPLTKSQSPTK